MNSTDFLIIIYDIVGLLRFPDLPRDQWKCVIPSFIDLTHTVHTLYQKEDKVSPTGFHRYHLFATCALCMNILNKREGLN